MAKSASVSEVRAWAKQQGFQLGDRGRLPAEVWDAWAAEKRTPLPAQRAGKPDIAAARAEDLEAAQARIARLEQHVAALTDRLAALEGRASEPRRLFARSR